MSTALEYGKTGLKIVTTTSSRPSPRVQALWPIPPIPIDKATLIDLALEPVAETGRKGIRITSRGSALPGDGSERWTLLHASYQGSAPSLLNWEEIPVGLKINLLVDQPMSSATHRFRLRCDAQGRSDLYPEVAIQTPADGTQGDLSNLKATIADMTSDGKITDSEKVQLRRWLEDQRQKWVSAYDAAVAAGMSTGAEPLAGRRDNLWKAAYGYFAGILYTTTGSFDSYGCVGLGAARTGTADIYPTRPVGENDPYKIDNGAWLTMLTGLQNAPLAVRSDIAALPATSSVKGLVKPGAGLTVAPDGTLQLSGGGTASWAGLSGAPVDSAPLMTLLGGKAALSHSHGAGDLPAYPTLASLGAVANTDSRLSDARVASDVYAWAKASTKPAYTAAEVGALGATAQAADSAKLGGQLPAYYQTALGFTPINKSGDSGIGNLSMGALTATTVDANSGRVSSNGLDGKFIINGRTDLGLFGDGNYGLYLGAPEGVCINLDSNGNGSALGFQVRTGGLGNAAGTLLFNIHPTTGAATFASSLGLIGGGTNVGLTLKSYSGPTHYNWKISTQDTTNACLEFAPSTADGSGVWAAPVLKLNGSTKAASFQGEIYALNDKLVYHSANIEQSASALMAVQAYALAPQWVDTLPALPDPRYPKAIWNSTTSRWDGGLVCIISTKAMYQNQNNAWVSVGSNFAIFGQAQIGDLAANSVGAGTLVSDLVLATIIRSTGYTAGTGSAAPVGFKFSGSGFTSYCLDGTTISNCRAEFGSDLNLGGYRALTVVDRVFWQSNRIRNGMFFESLEGWLATGAQPPAWSAITKTAGTGSASQVAIGPVAEGDGFIQQSFSIPKPLPGQTVQIQIQTGFSSTLNNGSAAGGVDVSLFDHASGTTVASASYNYTNNGQALAWTSRTLDITSAVSNGGDYTLKISLIAYHNSGTSQTVGLYVDEVKLIA